MVWQFLIFATLLSYAAMQHPHRGPYCFQCDIMASPDQCNNAVTCDQDLVCMLSENTLILDGHPTYRTACASPMECQAGGQISLFGKKRATRCHACCHGDFCNNKCDYEQVPASATPLVTAMLVPTKPTTNSTQQTTHPTTPTTSKTSTQQTTQPTTSTTSKTSTQQTTQPTTPTTSRTSTQQTTQPTTPTTSKTSTQQTTHPAVPTASTTSTQQTTQPTTPTTTHPNVTQIALSTPTTSTHNETSPSLKELCESHRYVYDEHSNLCYALHGEHATWDDANHRCNNTGGMLAVVDTPEKWELLYHIIRQHYHDDVYIGGRGHGTHTEDYHWTNGARFEFSSWAHGQPDYSREECVRVSNRDHNWHDTTCSNRHQYVCTMELHE